MLPPRGYSSKSRTQVMQNKRTGIQHIKRTLVIMFTIFALNGCSWTQPKPVIVTTEHINTCVTPPKSAQIVMRTPTFYVVKDENGVLWVALTPTDYQKLSENTAEILAHIKQKNAVIRYYKGCYRNVKNPK